MITTSLFPQTAPVKRPVSRATETQTPGTGNTGAISDRSVFSREAFEANGSNRAGLLTSSLTQAWWPFGGQDEEKLTTNPAGGGGQPAPADAAKEAAAGAAASAAAELGPEPLPGGLDLEKLVAAVEPSRRESARKSFPIILGEAQKQGVKDKDQLAYILATATHESNAGKDMEEKASGNDYAPGTKKGRRLGNTEPGDGPRFKGRGYAMLTGRGHYTNFSKRTGIDLVNDPDKAKDPELAAQILVTGMKDGLYTGRRLDRYVGNGKTNFEGARAVVNGSDRAADIAGIARKLRKAMG